MPTIDRSNTNWTPWPRLAGVPQRLQVIGGIAAIMGAAGVLFQWRLRVGGPKPGTMTDEWRKATQEMSDAKETESGHAPLVLNPITKSMRDKLDDNANGPDCCGWEGTKGSEPVSLLCKAPCGDEEHSPCLSR